jgi:hypothetical protein
MDFTVHTAPALLRERGDLWATQMPEPRTLPRRLLEREPDG